MVKIKDENLDQLKTDKIYLWDLGDNDTIDAHFATDGDHDRLEINDNSTDLLGDSSSLLTLSKRPNFSCNFAWPFL